VDLTPEGDSKGALVNRSDARCIEIWNLVFIQFNANADGTFAPLPARHVDTGMGFERVTAIIQGTKGLRDFANAKISNYETDVFRPLFDALEKLSGKKYGSTLPGEHTRPRVSPNAPPRSASGTPGTTETKHSRRNLPHFERPWAKYMVTFSTRERRQLSPSERDLVMRSILYAHEHRQYQLYAACVMPDHVHLLFEPQIKEQDQEGKPVFWPLSEILQGVKSASAHNINKASGKKEHVWEKESMDRMIRGQSDMEEKFHYICRNPWDAGVVLQTENYPWLWTQEIAANSREHTRASQSGPSQTAFTRAEDAVDEASTAAREGACAPPHAAAPLPQNEQEKIDIAFRVIADHIRTLSFAIADGIQPGNTDRNYVLRRILRRAVRYGRTLSFHEPFFYKLVEVLVDTMGDVFPEVRAKKKHVQDAIRTEEEAFNRTLDKGIEIFEEALVQLGSAKSFLKSTPETLAEVTKELDSLPDAFPATRKNLESVWASFLSEISGGLINVEFLASIQKKLLESPQRLPAWQVTFELSQDISALCDPANKLFEALQNVGDSPKALEGCRAGLREELKRLAIELPKLADRLAVFPGDLAFKLYDTYGFPLDLTELMARERGLTVDVEGFNKLMEEQKARGRAAQKKEAVSLSQIETTKPTRFVGYDQLETKAKVLEIVGLKDKTAVVLDTSVCYAEMGGQVGDTGELKQGTQLWRVTNTQKSGNTWLHVLEVRSPKSEVRSAEEIANRKSQIANVSDFPAVGGSVTLTVNKSRRNAIERHHTVTHLLHWALHEVVSREASQKGSFVGPDKLTFDFNSAPLTPQQVADIEKLVNERVLENAAVSWTEVPYTDVKSRKDVMQFFGDKYGDVVRVVQIGGHAQKLDGYSMELCGGTHTRATGEIGLFRIVGESAIAAGVRRIEAIAGLEAYRKATDELALIKSLAGKVNSPVHELENKLGALVEQQKELEKALKAAQQREASNAASELLERIHTVNGIPAIIHNVGAVDADFLQAIADSLKTRFKGVIVLGGGAHRGSVALIAAVTPEFTSKIQAGKIIQQIAPIVGGKGGGKPDNARGGGKDASKLDEALAKARSLLN
jgi:alanyl-tRNA synthetase/REP element-mobilizing transposase RayT